MITPLSLAVGISSRHGGGRQADHVEGADQIHLDHQRKGLQVVRSFATDDPDGSADARAIDGPLQSAIGVLGQLDGRLHALLVGDIGFDESGGLADFGLGLLTGLLVDVGQNHVRAAGRQKLGGGRPQSAAAARD